MKFITSLVTKVKGLLKRNPRRGLHSPKLTKKVMKWAIDRRSLAAYSIALCWPQAFILAIAVYPIFAATPPSHAGSPWLYLLSKVVYAVLAFLWLIGSLERPLRSWRKRQR